MFIVQVESIWTLADPSQEEIQSEVEGILEMVRRDYDYVEGSAEFEMVPEARQPECEYMLIARYQVRLGSVS